MKYKGKIKKYYRIIALINLVFSIMVSFLSKDFIYLIVFNLGYHMMYYTIAYGPIYQIKWIGQNSMIYEFALTIIRCFLLLTVIVVTLFLIIFMVNIFRASDYFQLLSLCMPVGIILGGLSSYVHLNELNDSLENYS